MDITKNIKVINVGLEFFWRELERQGVSVVPVDWSPPAQGRSEVLDLLKNLRKGKGEPFD